MILAIYFGNIFIMHHGLRLETLDVRDQVAAGLNVILMASVLLNQTVVTMITTNCSYSLLDACLIIFPAHNYRPKIEYHIPH
jgi:hypothetical protein